MSEVTVNIARQFSKYPAGRFKDDGPFPGELCRDKLLAPALRSANSVKVELDGTLGYGSSFLEEAFGGLVRECGFTFADLKQRLHLITKDQSLSAEVWSYMSDAVAKSV